MTLALIAGRGTLPAAVAAAASAQPVVCAYEGTSPEGLDIDLTFRLETLGTLLVRLGERGVTQVCFAGGIDRPQLDPTKLDSETAPLVPLFMEALQKGDDGALRVVMDLFERTGFTVLGADEVAPDLLAKGGVHSELWPDAAMRRDAEIAAEHILELSAKDIGQACVAGNGTLRAMEDAAGTDAMLAGLGDRGAGAILFKGPKAGQTRKIDLPTVGPETFIAAARAGLRGVVVDAGDVIVLDAPRCTALADEHGLVFWARTGE
ncbi:UDP-2,3-diacylglucosamine diphosphatase LpxI [Sulfitobacter sp. HNIBRBA3233]|uniref:LpxI family protein n=1 Tax=Sulfitobacter marinivivus TaxID=3158558 RepID=UPI0032DF331A